PESTTANSAIPGEIDPAGGNWERRSRARLKRMATLLINYADQGYFEAQKLNTTTGLLIGGLERAVSYSRKDLNGDFSNRNKQILAAPIGAGNWLWKPYIVMKALNEE